ncbi:DUF4198 domain-containing protein [Gluconobacter thailandicus]|uniref:DUF4198 domain-containing protein n=1 Tax=Gluconobacter thailandicus TaxID=257438 RepID=A0AAP9JH32_GLUTH|nr:DUF4198 domain-containing protein [Gluconobacter thailandicus]QEH95251.1 DUF4198 domain-containing protein [Gluconobacter thailandicus]
MKSKRSGLLVSGIVVFSLMGTVAQAHEIWFANRAKVPALIYGLGADDLDMVQRKSLITKVAAFDADMKPIKATLRPNGTVLFVDTAHRAAVLTAVMDNGKWSRRPDGEWVRQVNERLPGALASEQTLKFAMTIQAPLNTLPQVMPGPGVEVLPVTTNMPQHKDESLTVRVYFNGKPVGGAKVLPDFVNDPDAAPLLTAPDGTVTVKVRNQGLNVIAAAVDAKSEDKTIDQVEYSATLSFTLAHKPE